MGFRKRHLICVVGGGIVLLGVLCFTGCMGGAGGKATNKSQNAGGTPAGTYSVTITGTAGSISHAVNVQLVVN